MGNSNVKITKSGNIRYQHWEISGDLLPKIVEFSEAFGLEQALDLYRATLYAASNLEEFEQVVGGEHYAMVNELVDFIRQVHDSVARHPVNSQVDEY